MRWHRFVLLPRDEISRELLYLFLQEKKVAGLWEKEGKIIVYIEEKQSLDDLPVHLVSYVEKSEELESDWKNNWKKNFQVVWVEKNISIRPPWIKPTGANVDLVIYPGLAFGTGHHPTTLCCLKMLRKYCEKKGSLLDVGTGSGILSIFASKIGISKIVAIDIDPLAQKELQRNCVLNNIHPQKIHFRLSSLAEVRERFDLLVVNISASFVIENTYLLRERLYPGGLLIASGFEERDLQEVRSRLSHVRFEGIDWVVQDNWVTMVFTRA